MSHNRSNGLQFSRRQLLAATGLGTASLFLPSLGGSRVKAQSGPIKRLVIMTQRHGTVREKFRMLRNNKDYGNWEYAFDDPDPQSFSEILAPLHPHRSDLLVLEGLAQASSIGNPSTNNHNTGHLHILTGAKMIDEMNAGGPSVDQIIAKQIAVPGRIRSLEMSTQDPFIGGMINLDAGQRAPVETSPRAIFNRLFPKGSAPSMQAKPTERDLIRAARSSVLDFVANEYAAIAPRLGREDRARLDMHRDLIRDLEMRVSAQPSLMCTAPGAVSDDDNQVKAAKTFADLTAAAFACDLTRVASIQVGELSNEEFGAPPGDVHQDFAHQTDTDPNAAEQMAKYNRTHAEIFAYLLDSLKRYKDGNGTLLDSTAVMWISELATGPHELDRITVVMGGSAGGYFRTGRYLSYSLDQPNPNLHPDAEDNNSRPVGPGHSHLLISLMQSMGLSNNQIGMTSVTTHDGSNRTIDLTGPLPRLT